MKKWKIGKSDIHGKGMICRSPIEDGEIIDMVFDKVNTTGDPDKDWDITKAGRCVNHSWKPNTKMNRQGNTYYLQAIKNININDEIVSNYNDTPDFISKADPTWD